MTTKVFISYRRGDVDAEAGRLRDSLVQALGQDAVFLDVSTIAPGKSFPNEILDALQESNVILAVIGPGWLGAHDEFHRRRLDKEEDWVRKELSIALKDSTTTVIPVLLKDTKMPPAEALPEEIALLCTQNAAMPIQTDTFERDIGPLINHVTTLCNQGNEQQSSGGKGIAPYLEWVRQKYSTVELLG
ncbi:MAG: toll/interleukin-1 receptor domain-containing protein, partial [Gammaproteobacteria bacterium]